MPKVSIIIPAYNAMNSLARCLDSALSQDYFNIEIIVIDDGSTDNTLEVAELYSDNISLYKQSNKGACSARNLGVKKSTGDFVKFLDSDDFLMPGAISEQILFSKELNKNSIPYGYRKVLDNDFYEFFKEEIPSEKQMKELINSNITITLPLHRKEVLLSVGLFDENLKFRQEWDLHLRIVNEGYIFHYHDTCIFTQVISDSPTRISSRVLNLKNEIENIDYVRSKYTNLNSNEFKAAWALKYWTLGRQFLKSNQIKESEFVFKIAKSITPEYYLILQPRLYRLVVKALGPSIAEKFVSLYNLFSK